tara:strand:- start:9238 stop:9699 length:462 start_codon:yes stop_codon:yes gene_type:complete
MSEESLEEYARRINASMTKNLNTSAYRDLSSDRVPLMLDGPTPYYPIVTDADYSRGEFTRHFFVRYNGIITEVSNKEASKKKGKITKGLYYYVPLKWRIVENRKAPKGFFDQNTTCASVNRYFIEVSSKRLPEFLRPAFTQYFANLEAFKLST